MSASTDINADKLAEFFVEDVEGVPAATAAPVCSASPQLQSSFH